MLVFTYMYIHVCVCVQSHVPATAIASHTEKGQEAKVGWHARRVRLGLVLKVLKALPEVAQKHVLAHELPAGRTGEPIKPDSHDAHFNISFQAPGARFHAAAPVDADALADIHQVRTREEASAVPRVAEHALHKGCSGSLALCASNVDDFQAV